MKRVLLILFALPWLASAAETTLSGTLYKPFSLTPASCTVTIKGPTVPTLSGSTELIPAYKTILTGSTGAYSFTIQPNDAMTVTGTKYYVEYNCSGVRFQEWWSVPTSGSPLTIASVRTASVVTPSSLTVSLSNILQSGATDGQYAKWSASAGSWVAADAPTGGGTGAVDSVFGRTGTVVATSGDYSTTLVTEGTNLYFTNARARSAISGTSPISFDSATGIISCSTCVTSNPVASVFGRTGTVVASTGDYTAAQVTNAVDSTQSYSNPAWITSLAYGKLTGTPPSIAYPQTGLIAQYDLFRNNLAYCSEKLDCSGTGYQFNNVTYAIPGDVADPWGGTTMAKLTTVGTNVSSRYVWWQQTADGSAWNKTLSIYCKTDGSSVHWVVLGFTNAAGSWVFSWFDCSNGTLGSASPTATRGITAAANGTYRAYVTFSGAYNNDTVTDNSGIMFIGMAASDNATILNSGGTNGDYIYISGLMYSDGPLYDYESTGTTIAEFRKVVNKVNPGTYDLTMGGTTNPVWLNDKMYFENGYLTSADNTLTQAANGIVVVGDIEPVASITCPWVGTDSSGTGLRLDVCYSGGFPNTLSLNVQTKPGTIYSRPSLRPGTNTVIWSEGEGGYDAVFVNGDEAEIAVGAAVSYWGTATRSNFGKFLIGSNTSTGAAIPYKGFIRQVLVYSNGLVRRDAREIVNTAKLLLPTGNWDGKKPALHQPILTTEPDRSQLVMIGDSITEAVGVTHPLTYIVPDITAADFAQRLYGPNGFPIAEQDRTYTTLSVSSNTLTVNGAGNTAFNTPFTWILSGGAPAKDFGYLKISGSSTSALNNTWKVTGSSSSNLTATTSGVSDGSYLASGVRVEQWTPVNLGQQGDTCRGNYDRMPVIKSFFMPRASHNAAFVWCGVNDLASMDAAPAARWAEKAWEAAHQNGAKYVFIPSIMANTLSVSSLCASMDVCRSTLSKLYESMTAGRQFDIFVPIADNRVSANGSMSSSGTACGGFACSSDGVHPSSAGYQYAIAPYFAAAIDRVVAPAGPRKITGNTSVTQNETHIDCDATSGAVTITYPLIAGQVVEIANIGTANNCTVTAAVFPTSNGPTYTPLINGSASINIAPGEFKRVKTWVPDWSTANPVAVTY